MLCSFPVRPHVPIVDGRKCTFAARRISAASWSVIQSEAATIAGDQSVPPELEPEPEPDPEPDDEPLPEPDDDGAALPPDFPAPPSFEPAPVDSPVPPFDSDEAPPPSPDPAFESVGSPAREAAFVRALELRSFFAQPEPLNTIAGGANPLRIVPSAPHSGQKRGPSSLIPWRMSVLCRQTVQAYS